jgi:hypothetical protein
MIVVTKFYADDGTEFQTAMEAIDYDFIQQLKRDFGWSDTICQSVLDNCGRIHYLIGEYMKNFPDVGCT